MELEGRLTNEGLDESKTARGGEPRGNWATVPASMEDAEAPMLGQQQWEAVHARHAQGQTISAIARE